jgi:hypothetical protein
VASANQFSAPITGWLKPPVFHTLNQLRADIGFFELGERHTFKICGQANIINFCKGFGFGHLYIVLYCIGENRYRIFRQKNT